MKSKNDKIKIRWTSKEVLIGKTFHLIILTLILSIVLIKLANAGLTFIGNIGNTTLTRYNYSFGLYSLVLVIPAIFFSIATLKMIMNRKGGDVDYINQEEALTLHKKETRFKWHRVYSMVIGYITMILMFRAYGVLSEYENDITLKSTLLLLVFFIACFIIPIIVSNVLNKIMIKITATNKELLEEIKLGVHNDKIPDRYLNNKDFFGIIKILENAEALSIISAVRIYKVKVVVLNICKIYFIVSIVVGGIILLITMGAINIFVSEAGSSIQGFNGSYSGTSDNSQKWNQAEQAKKKADFDRYQANKAAGYNANSYDAYRKKNIANASRQEADRLNREKYR